MENIEINEKNNSRTNRRLFSKAEDDIIMRFFYTSPIRKWEIVSRQIPGRTARQCRDRFNNYLHPKLTNHEWCSEEDLKLIEKVKSIGFKWVTITKSFPGRSSNNVKNRWYKHLCHQCDFIKKKKKIDTNEQVKINENVSSEEIIKNVFGKTDDMELVESMKINSLDMELFL